MPTAGSGWSLVLAGWSLVWYGVSCSNPLKACCIHHSHIDRLQLVNYSIVIALGVWNGISAGGWVWNAKTIMLLAIDIVYLLYAGSLVAVFGWLGLCLSMHRYGSHQSR